MTAAIEVAARRRGLASPGSGLFIVAAAIAFPYLVLERNVLTGHGDDDVIRIYLICAYSGFLAWSMLAFAATREKPGIVQRGDVPLFVFLASAFVGSLYHADPAILLNLYLFGSFLFSVRFIAQRYPLRRPLQLTALALLSFVGAAWFMHAPPEERWLGGIHPNILGGCTLACVVFAAALPRFWFHLATAASLLVSVAVSSRFSMVSIVVFYLAFIWLTLRAARLPLVLGLVAAVLGTIAASELGPVSDILALDSVERGLDSGLTGREAMWAGFLPQLEEAPLFGFGFRNRDGYVDTHNGYMNAALETGAVGGLCLMLFLSSCLVRSLRLALTDSENVERHALMFAGLAAVSLAAVFQPQLINFGDPFGFLAIVLMAVAGVRAPPGQRSW